MRLLFCATGGSGHVRPLQPLAAALQRQGHAVAWASAPDALPALAGDGATLFAAGDGFADSRRELAARYPELQALHGEQRAAQTFPRLFGATLAPAMLAGVRRAITQWQPDLVVHEPAALAAPLACALHGLRYATHGYGLPVPAGHLAAATRCLLAAPAAQGLQVPPTRPLLQLDIAPASLLGPQAGVGRRLALNAYAVRAGAGAALPADLQAALRPGPRPRVYLSFGTVFHQAPALQAALQALLALDVELVVTAGDAGVLARLRQLAPRSGRLHLRIFVDQAALLPHCDAVVSHGGAGSMLGAAAHGLPQLLLPQGADHFRNGRALAALGAGLVVDGAAQTVAGIRAAATRWLAGGAHAAAARRLALEMAAMPSADDAAAALQRACR